MLNWKKMPHQWFRKLVQWSLYRAILECDLPMCFAGRSLRRTLVLDHMTNDNFRQMCETILLASKSAQCHRLTGYQAEVLYRVLGWVFNGRLDVVNVAIASVEAAYFPETGAAAAACTFTAPLPSDFRLELFDGRLPPNGIDADPEMRLLLHNDVGIN